MKINHLARSDSTTSFVERVKKLGPNSSRNWEFDWWEVWGVNYFGFTMEFRFKALSYTKGL